MEDPFSDEFAESETAPPPYRSASPSISSTESEWSDDEDDLTNVPCVECNESHPRRRLVICMDGTWMLPDGAVGSFSGNPSSIFRIWCMVKEGVVRDSNWEQFEQIRAPFIDGIGAVDNILKRYSSGITGSGFELKILEAYKHCCSLCSTDEVFLFGFSRGAFIARAVAGLLHHMKALKPDLKNFDEKFLEGLKKYRAAQDKSSLTANGVYRYMAENTRPGPKVKFLGLIDTVKALQDDNLHDIDTVKSIQCIRHALALFEKRTVMSPERYNLDKIVEAGTSGRSVQEAWFAGTHGNLGGSCPEDGLALFPLHWLVTEAQDQGLRVGFKPIEQCPIVDPTALIKLRVGDTQLQCISRSGIKTQMADFQDSLDKGGYFPNPHIEGKSFPLPQEFREVFKDGKLIGGQEGSNSGCFIHPSVFLLDHLDEMIVQVISYSSFGAQLRKEQINTTFPDHKLFWPLLKELGLHRQTERPRVLVSGLTMSGKTSLIDAVLDVDSHQVSHGATQGAHNVEVSRESHGRSIILHDSQGFESGNEANYELLQNFLTQRRVSPHFSEQVHCIWHCVSTDHPRIHKSDKRFAKLDFGDIPVILVFTKQDRLINDKKSQALVEYNRANGTRYDLQDLGSIEQAHKARILARADTLLREYKTKITREWTTKLAIFTPSLTTFVGLPQFSPQELVGQGSLDTLQSLSVSSMTSQRISSIHAHAQTNFHVAKLSEMIKSVVSLCDKHGDIWSTIRRGEGIFALRIKLVEKTVQICARTLEFEGFQNPTLTHLIRETLFPFGSSSDSTIFSARNVGVSALTMISSAAHLAFPLIFLATGPASIASWTWSSLKQSNGIVITCVEALLIMDRIFWYGDGRIEEKHVKAALIWYLKIRMPTVTELDKELNAFDSISSMGSTLRKIIDQFRYQRTESTVQDDSTVSAQVEATDATTAENGSGSGDNDDTPRPTQHPVSEAQYDHNFFRRAGPERRTDTSRKSTANVAVHTKEVKITTAKAA